MKKTIAPTVMTSPEYRQFIEDLKTRVVSARISAARAVNRDLILLYWDIGSGVVERQQALGWGDAVVETVAADLRRAFPEIRGFSLANVWRMRQLHMAYSAEEDGNRPLSGAGAGRGWWFRRSRPEHPSFRFVYLSGPALLEGVEEHDVGGVTVHVFAAARPLRTASNSETRSAPMWRSRPCATTGACTPSISSRFGASPRRTG